MVREGLTEDSPLASVDGLINRIVRIIHALDCRERVVEIRLFELLPVSVDIVESLVGIYRDEVGSYADVSSILPVEVVEPQVSVSF